MKELLRKLRVGGKGGKIVCAESLYAGPLFLARANGRAVTEGGAEYVYVPPSGMFEAQAPSTHIADAQRARARGPA